jgi:hypothetical protein
MSEKTKLGKNPPRYNFFLNPYEDENFIHCPECDGRTRLRKLPLVIHVDPMNLISLNKTCQYCPRCDLLIAHQDELEAMLTELFKEHDPEVVGNDYLVLGTMDTEDWERGQQEPMAVKDVMEYLYEFKQVLQFEREE